MKLFFEDVIKFTRLYSLVVLYHIYKYIFINTKWKSIIILYMKFPRLYLITKHNTRFYDIYIKKFQLLLDSSKIGVNYFYTILV